MRRLPPQSTLFPYTTLFRSEHLRDLSRALRSTGSDARSVRFVTSFVRPFGREQEATPLVVAALLDLARQQPRAWTPGLAGIAARPFVWVGAQWLRVQARGGLRRVVVGTAVAACVRLLWAADTGMRRREELVTAVRRGLWARAWRSRWRRIPKRIVRFGNRTRRLVARRDGRPAPPERPAA